jgi:hypothetical protein
VALSPYGAGAARMALKRPGKPVGARNLVKRTRTPPARVGTPKQPPGRQPRPDVVHSSLYLPEPVHEALREAAFHERCKIHDIIMQGIEAALKKRGYPSIADLRAGKKR